MPSRSEYPQPSTEGPVCPHGFQLGNFCKPCDDAHDAAMTAKHGPLWFLQGAKLHRDVPGGAIG